MTDAGTRLSRLGPKLLWRGAMSDPSFRQGVYGAPPTDLVDLARETVQLSPLVPGAARLEELPDDALASLVVLAPPGAVERRYVLAQALRALEPGGRLVALAPRDRGGARLKAELEGFGCAVAERSKAHHRICEVERPSDPAGLAAAIEGGSPRHLEELGLWTQAGIFSFDRIDPGTALLLETLKPLKGQGADLGSGLGIISRAVLRSAKVSALHLVEIDRRAGEAAQRNVEDARVRFHWADARSVPLADLDFVVSNPPFHAEGAESRSLGQDFVRAAARMLRRSGTLHLVANRHLPYEAVLRERFVKVDTIAEGGGYKVFEAVK